MNDIREAELFGVRPIRTFRAAATKYLEEHTHKKTLSDDAIQVKMLDPFIGDLDLRHVHIGAFQKFIAKRKAEGVRTRTVTRRWPSCGGS